jgi:uncharacterized protein (DUF342 family)
MRKSVVSKGKTVKDAISIALDILSANKNEVEIEIIKNETKGILGLGSKPAVVRVMVKEPETDAKASPNPLSSFDDLEKTVNSLGPADEHPGSPSYKSDRVLQINEDLWGKIWVKDGAIFCKNAPDKYPLVSPGRGIKLYKNDELVEKTVVIDEDDVLHVELQDEMHEPSWELKLTDDKMEAILEVVPGMRIFRRLKDSPPSDYVQLEVEEKKVAIIMKTEPIMDKLKELGIIHGVDYAEIARACTSEEAGSFVIAKGIPPTPGKNGYFIPLQELEIKKGLKEREDGTIDYREIQEFPSVQRGEIIGIIHPPVPGIPGRTVNNEPVFPPEVHPLVVKEGRGVILVENGTKVLATEPGHPDIKQTGQLAIISVIPKLLISNDINLQTGNVHYDGDVEILGNVQDGMLVEVQENVLIRKNVHASKILAGNSIIIQHNIIASELTAGKGNLLKAEISQILDEFIEQMKRMTAAINQLASVSAFKVTSFTRTGLGPLIKILCDGKFKLFPSLIETLIDKIKSGTSTLGEEWIKFKEQLESGFQTISSPLQSVEDLIKLIKTAEQLNHSIQDSDNARHCFIKAGFAHNSKLYSSGDIFMLGEGTYNSKLHAGGFVEVQGLVRGGEIYAAKGVKIKEAGAKGGICTKITVPKEQTIRIQNVLEDTVIQIGTKMHKFTTHTFNVVARLNEDGQILFS